MFLLLSCIRAEPPAVAMPVPAFTPGPIRVVPPDLDGMLLFADELEVIEAAVAGFLTASGYTVQDATCTPTDAEIATLRLDCAGGCVLSLATAAHPDRSTIRWQTPVTAPLTPQAIQAAVPLLVPIMPVEARTGRGEDIAWPDERGVSAVLVGASAGWSDAAAVLESIDLDACWTDRDAHRRSPVILSVDAGGGLQRCEPLRTVWSPAPETDCVCAQLEDADFGPGGERRAALRVHSHQPTPVNRSRQLITAHLSVEADVGAHGLGGCLARAPQAADAIIPVRFSVGADGTLSHSIDGWPGWVDEAAQACLDQRLAEAQLPCPGEVQAEIIVRVE